VRGVHEYQDFYASHDHMPGKAGTMRVTGTVVFATSGWSCDLREREANTGINTEVLGLELLLTPPAEGQPVLEVLTPCAVEWSVDDPPYEYREVRFTVNTDDDPPPAIGVDHPE
jgi:hypothetical protein